MLATLLLGRRSRPLLTVLAWLTTLITAGCQVEAAGPAPTPTPSAPAPTPTRPGPLVAVAQPSPTVAQAAPPATATLSPSPTPQPTDSPTATPVPPSPSRVEARQFDSPTLGARMNYLVYLPPGYDTTPDRRYPVLTMLHGAGADEGPSYTEWSDLGLLDTADTLIEAGQLQPLLIVLPQGDTSYWLDQMGDGPQYGTYVARDVVGEIDTHFRTLPERAARAVGGLSMGADGALQLALNFPTVFGAAGAHSPSLPRPGYAPSLYGDAAHYRTVDPVSLVQARPAVAASLRLWLDVGADDPRLAVAQALHDQLDAAGIPHEWHVFPGEHHWDYWHAHVADYLLFYNAALSSGPAMSRPSNP